MNLNSTSNIAPFAGLHGLTGLTGLTVIAVVETSRAELIADGDLHDVSAMAKEAGIRFPVALSRALWEDVQAIPAQYACEDVEGRLWDVVWMFRCAAFKRPASELWYSLILHTAGNEDRDGHYTVKAVCGPGDSGEPVVTLLKFGEDYADASDS